MIWETVRKLLFRFDAEAVHGFAFALIRVIGRICPLILRMASGTWIGAGRRSLRQPVTVLGIEFGNPVGLAAGFDKNAEILPYLPHLGFGFVEIGTVTPRPQGGNPRPRLFRDAARGAVFNRMGFNGLGAAVVSERVRAARRRLPPGFRIGINLGKNKDTPLERAPDDYAAAARPFRELADYFVINVSSPNTPGLRSLQTTEALLPILRAVVTEIAPWRARPPILVKLAPELGAQELAELGPALESAGVAGWVVTNTLGGVWKDGIAGGWSGEPVREASERTLIALRKGTERPIISVGGILTAEEAKKRLSRGASLIQIYSGWILTGPRLPTQILRALMQSPK